MPRKPPLRSVQPGETAPKPLTVVEAADVGRLELLVALRSRISLAVDDPNAPARDLAPLARRLLEIAREIESLKDSRDDDVGRAAATSDDGWQAI